MIMDILDSTQGKKIKKIVMGCQKIGLKIM